MSVMVLAATMTSVSESSAKHRRGMAGVENYELSFEHVPDLSELHLRCAGGRLYSPTRIRRRLVVYPGACVMWHPPVTSNVLLVRCRTVDRTRAPSGENGRKANLNRASRASCTGLACCWSPPLASTQSVVSPRPAVVRGRYTFSEKSLENKGKNTKGYPTAGHAVALYS